MNRILTLSLAFTLSLAAASACGGKGGDAGGTASNTTTKDTPEEGAFDIAQLSGTWQGPFGTLTVKAPGEATLELRNCAYEILGAGRIKMPDDPGTCEAKTYRGELRLKPHTLSIGDAKEGFHNFAAYLDAAGALHLGISGRAKIGRLEDKAGTFKITMFDTLTVSADGTCIVTSEMKREDGAQAAPCRFETHDGQEIFLYTLPGEKEEGLVWLPTEQLLVPPAIAAMAFVKQN